MNNLSFKKLRKTNVKRCNAVFHPLKSWTETDWACALAGEVGELCNFIKKRKRVFDAKGNIKLPHKEDCRKELADIITYADLLAARMDIDLGKAVINKFNEVSDRQKTSIKLK